MYVESRTGAAEKTAVMLPAVRVVVLPRKGTIPAVALRSVALPLIGSGMRKPVERGSMKRRTS